MNLREALRLSLGPFFKERLKTKPSCKWHGVVVTPDEANENLLKSAIENITRGPSIARDVGSSSTNRSSDIMHFLPRLLKKTL